MGFWANREWKWTFKWRRKFFAWEDELLGNPLLAVNQTTLRVNTSDVRRWSWDKSSSFSVSNFVLRATKSLENENISWDHGRLAWRNLAPPRAQLHVWFILQGRLNTKERLFRFGTPGVDDDRCVFCMEEPETIEHLFFCCKLSSNLWYYCCGRWNISICIPKQPKACLLSWLGAPFRRFDKKMWVSLFHVVSWSIWDIRNKVVFQNFKPNWDFEKKRLVWRLGTWMKGWCPNFPFSPENLTDNLSDIRNWSG